MSTQNRLVLVYEGSKSVESILNTTRLDNVFTTADSEKLTKDHFIY